MYLSNHFIVVYLNHQTGASDNVPWSKSDFSSFNILLLDNSFRENISILTLFNYAGKTLLCNCYFFLVL